MVAKHPHVPGLQRQPRRCGWSWRHERTNPSCPGAACITAEILTRDTRDTVIKKKTGEPEVPFWKLHMEFFEGSANVKDRTTLNFESRSLTTPNVGLFLFHQFVDPVSSSYTCDLRDRWWMGEIPGEATKNGHLNLRSFQVARGMGKKMNLLRFSTDILDVHRFSRSKSQMSSQYWRYPLVY